MHSETLQFDEVNDLATGVDELLIGLRSGDQLQLVSTALLLAEMGSGAADAVTDLVDILSGDGGREVRWAAAYALGRIGRPAVSAADALALATEDHDPDVRDEAQRALARVLTEESLLFGAFV